jgi:hypothetical protein
MPTRQILNEDDSPKVVHQSEVSDEDSLKRPTVDLHVDDPVKYSKDLAFLNEEVEVMILPSYDRSDTTQLVEVSIRGKSYWFLRGQWRKVPRFVLERLATAKHQAWQFGYKQTSNGATVQTQSGSNILRYPHQFRDTNPEGQIWYDSIKEKAA